MSRLMAQTSHNGWRAVVRQRAFKGYIELLGGPNVGYDFGINRKLKSAIDAP